LSGAEANQQKRATIEYFIGETPHAPPEYDDEDYGDDR